MAALNYKTKTKFKSREHEVSRLTQKKLTEMTCETCILYVSKRSHFERHGFKFTQTRDNRKYHARDISKRADKRRSTVLALYIRRCLQ